MKKILTLLIVIALAGYIPVAAQTFEDFKKQRKQEMQQMKQDQKASMQLMQKEFDDYVIQRDKEFAEYLKKTWEEHELLKALKPVPKPKPVEEPRYIMPAGISVPLKLNKKESVIEIQSQKNKEIILPRIEKQSKEIVNKNTCELEFYGNYLSLDYDEELIQELELPVNENSISNFWTKLSESNYIGLLDQLLEQKIIMNLNDWAYYLLVKNVSSNIYPDSKNEAELFSWMLMNRSGYKAKVAYSQDEASILLPSFQTIYFSRFIIIDDITFYMFDPPQSEKIYTYKNDFPDATQLIDFNIYRPLNFSTNTIEKDIVYSYNGNDYPVKIELNKNLIDFYNDYPVVNINVYFNSVVGSETKESILLSFIPIIRDLNQNEAARMLLDFVQNTFQYQIDDEQFGKEKFFFPEEVFFYPYSDCEDRSALYSYLVSELLELKVLGLAYDSHVATAIHFDDEVIGDFVVYKNEKYLIADPTYINAPMGMAMPEHRNAEAEIIELANNNNEWEKINNFWQLAMDSKALRGGTFNDAILDNDGNAYLTGYISGEANFAEHVFEGSDQRQMFIIKYNKDGAVVWVDVFEGKGESTGFAVTIDDQGFPIIAGSFSGELKFTGSESIIRIPEEASDVVLVKYTPRGRMLWAQNAGLNHYDQNIYLTYVSWFSEDGEHDKNKVYNENENFNNYGLFTDATGKIYFAGAFNNTTGIGYVKTSYMEAETYDPVTSLKAENDLLISQNYEPTIAGIFAVTNLMNYIGYQLSGIDALTCFDRYNPEFKENFEDIYETLGKIHFIINDNGIINITTNDGDDINFDKINIDNNSKIKITKFDSGDTQIDILEGIEVGKFFVWFNLNYVKLYKENGDMLFDYDDDHTQKTMNLKEDILD